MSIFRIGEELGINPNMLGRRKKKLKGDGGKAFIGQEHARDEEMVALRRELNRAGKDAIF